MNFRGHTTIETVAVGYLDLSSSDPKFFDLNPNLLEIMFISFKLAKI